MKHRPFPIIASWLLAVLLPIFSVTAGPFTGHNGTYAGHEVLSTEHDGTYAGHEVLSAEHDGTYAGHELLSAEHDGTYAGHEVLSAEHDGTYAGHDRPTAWQDVATLLHAGSVAGTQSTSETAENNEASDRNGSPEDGLFQKAMQFYRDSEFDSAAFHFSKLDNPEAWLFSGKSYFAISNYPLAKLFLQKLSREDDPRLYDEARYTLSLVGFQTRLFGESLDLLHNIKSRPAYQNLHRDAESMYQQIMGYLSTDQRKMAFHQSKNPRVQFDLLRFGIDHMNRSEAKELFRALRPYYEAVIDTNLLGAMHRRIESIPTTTRTAGFGKAPDGIVYNIGIMLPQAEQGTRDWQISRSLYNGYLLAANEFNRAHNNKSIRLHLMQTSDGGLTEEAAFARLAWKYHVDAIIGPLYSDAAFRIRELAEYYKIPVIPPLANADTLNIHNPYLYQINPTFESRGRAMAGFAVNVLELDTLAVITQSNQPVSREAREFRNEAERLGATVLYYFSEDFDARAFEVGHITPWFAGDIRFVEQFFDDENFVLQPVKGLYLSFTGGGSDQLIDLILNDLQAFRSRVTILGNEDMAHVNLSGNRRHFFDIYYSSFFHRDDEKRMTYQFQSNYQSLTGRSPDQFAHLGYDTATFLFQSINKLENPVRLKQRLRRMPRYDGVVTSIDFRGNHVNQHLHFMTIDQDRSILFEQAEDAPGAEEP